MEAFFGCLYYAALRPSEAVALREADLRPARLRLGPDRPGRLQPPRRDRVDRRRRQPRRNAASSTAPPGETRSIPIPPALVELLRSHLKRYGTGPGGRLFRTARGGPLNDTGYGEVWQRARPVALTPAQQAITAGPPPLRPAARRRVPVAQRRRPRHRGRPPRRPRRRRPAQRLRQLHRRPGRPPPTSASATPSTNPAATDLTPEAGVGFSCGAESVLRAGGGNPKGRAALAGP